MGTQLTLEYWITENWYVGKLQEVPGVFSQGQTLDELEENVRDAYAMMMEEETDLPRAGVHTKAIEVAG
jgi:predicted RNase H-like HicB family nuclease